MYQARAMWSRFTRSPVAVAVVVSPISLLVACGGSDQAAAPAAPVTVTVPPVTVTAPAAPSTPPTSAAPTPDPTVAAPSPEPTSAAPTPEETAGADEPDWSTETESAEPTPSLTPTTIGGLAQGGAVAGIGPDKGYAYMQTDPTGTSKLSGVIVRVTKMTLRKPDSGASVTATSEQTGLHITVKVENKSQDETVVMRYEPNVTAGGTQAESYTDNGTGITGFKSLIRPGRSGTADYAYLIDKDGASDVEVQITPTNGEDDYGPAIFQGKAPS